MAEQHPMNRADYKKRFHANDTGLQNPNGSLKQTFDGSLSWFVFLYGES